MAVGSMAKKMLGFADDFIAGATKGTDAQIIRSSVNKVKSNMTSNQKKVLQNANYRSTSGTQSAVRKSGKKSTSSSGSLSGSQNLNISTTKNINTGKPGNSSLGVKAGDFFGGGIRETVKGVKSGGNIKDSMKGAYMDGDKLRMDRVAGTFMAASAAGRIASGGGLYKDKNGNTNIIGLPFI